MSGSKHTPGPWKARIGGPAENTVRAADGFIIAVVNQFAESWGNQEDDHNTHLIAAAPDMRSALETIADLAVNEPDQLVGYVLASDSPVRAAITKAKGGGR